MTDEGRIRAIKLAVVSMKCGMSLRAAAEEYDIPRTTLLRHRRLNAELALRDGQSGPLALSEVKICKRGRPPVFTDEQEQALSRYCVQCSDMYCGLSRAEARKLAHSFANELKLAAPPSWAENDMSGQAWFRNFMRRQPSLSMRVPEATSLARVNAFNPATVRNFFELIRSVSVELTYEPNSIWNLDETGVTTVHRPQRVLSRRGTKRVGKVTAAERGQLLTMAIAVSATGNKMPPFFVFPRRRFQTNFLDNGPVGCSGTVSPSGWMNSEIFLELLKHFKSFTRVSVKHPLLLILDNHESHKSVEAIEYCRANGIHVLTIPPHCSHRLQPLDVSVFSPFKHALNVQCDSWTYANPGKAMTVFDLPALIDRALEVSATEGNIKSGFRASGIWPLNPDIFSEIDFMPATVSGEPSTSSGEASSTNPACALDDRLRAIRPIPKAPPRTAGKRGRKPGKATILTDPAEMAAQAEVRRTKAAAAERVKRPRGRPRKETK